MSLEDARRRMANRVNMPVPLEAWKRPEYIEDFDRLNPTLSNLRSAIVQRHDPSVFAERFNRERKRQFKARPRSVPDTYETFTSVHRLLPESNLLEVVLRGDHVLLSVHRYERIRLMLTTEDWWCEASEEWWDGCRIGSNCYTATYHFHVFLTNVVADRDAASRIHQNGARSQIRVTRLERVEEMVALCADHFGIPDAEIEH